jgi:hypothetical protein
MEKPVDIDSVFQLLRISEQVYLLMLEKEKACLLGNMFATT